MSITYIISLVVSALLIIAVALPLIKNDYWIFRIFEYPRYQKLVCCFVMLLVWIATTHMAVLFNIIIAVLLFLCVVYLLYKIWPYTPLSPREMKTVAATDDSMQLKLFTFNVYQYNEQYAALLAQVRKADPDIIMLLETDETWAEQVKELKTTHPYTLLQPQENTYGLLFYSRLQLVEGSILFRVEADVPSVEATIALRNGQHIKFFGLHPKPPVPGESDRSKEKDKELMKVALLAKQESLPVIVSGDLNDVAWSYVTELFRKTSELLDPRRGRGFYSTFSAKNWFMRFPLDYVFCSSQFGLISMRRLNPCGSDHFPMFSHFQFIPALEKVQDTPTADASEKKEAVEKAMK
jgi:endonuclease/exonuclease/phosphatase (EEP) superfamily protein YafD